MNPAGILYAYPNLFTIRLTWHRCYVRCDVRMFGCYVHFKLVFCRFDFQLQAHRSPFKRLLNILVFRPGRCHLAVTKSPE